MALREERGGDVMSARRKEATMKSTAKKLHLAALPAKPATANVTRKDYREAKEWVLARERAASGAGISIFDRYFSVEQQAQINRLQVACGFEGATERDEHDKTIATLAQAALWVLGLDPLSDDAFTRISDIVLGKGVDAEISNDLFDRQLIAQDWTKKQRAAEIGEEPRSAKAEEAGA
jgi:hypothetical protein